MSAWIRRNAVWTLMAVASALPLSFVGGCGDMVTYANKSREEGMRLYRENMYADAAGAFRNAVRQDPRDYHSHFYLGVCYNEMKQYQQAFQEFYTALEVMGNTQEGKFDDSFRRQVLDTLAASIAQNDDQETELNKADKRAHSSQKAEDWFLLGKIYRLRSDADMAMNAYRQAANADPSNFYINKEYGLYLLDPLNQAKDAEYYLRKAYRLEPNDDAVNTALARLGVRPPPADKAKEDAPRGSAAKLPTPH